MSIRIDTAIPKSLCTGDMYVGKDWMTLRSVLIFASMINMEKKTTTKNSKITDKNTALLN